MDIEIDASGKVEPKQRQDMAVAFADGKQGSILIPQKVKNQALETYQRRRRSKHPRVKALLFALLVYLLLRDHITELDRVKLDREYKG